MVPVSPLVNNALVPKTNFGFDVSVLRSAESQGPFISGLVSPTRNGCYTCK